MKIPYHRKGTALIVVVAGDILSLLNQSHEPLSVSQIAKELNRKPGIIALTLEFLFRHGWITNQRGKWRYKQAAADKDVFFITKSGKQQLTKKLK
jgi:predicted transcriptional regulator